MVADGSHMTTHLRNLLQVVHYNQIYNNSASYESCPLLLLTKKNKKHFSYLKDVFDQMCILNY